MSRKIGTIARAGAGTGVALLVRRMLQIVTIAVGLVGCVMPPDADYVQPPANQPPRITIASPTPNLDFVYQGPGCNPLEQAYSVFVRDPDLGDTLYWRAFVDYPRDASQEFSSGELKNADADLNIRFPVRGDDQRFGKLTDKPHIVELIVADRPFAEDFRAPRAHVVLDVGLSTSITWTVQWVDTGCGP
jgi:hypothetical protein